MPLSLFFNSVLLVNLCACHVFLLLSACALVFQFAYRRVSDSVCRVSVLVGLCDCQFV